MANGVGRVGETSKPTPNLGKLKRDDTANAAVRPQSVVIKTLLPGRTAPALIARCARKLLGPDKLGDGEAVISRPEYPIRQCGWLGC